MISRSSYYEIDLPSRLAAIALLVFVNVASSMDTSPCASRAPSDGSADQFQGALAGSNGELELPLGMGTFCCQLDGRSSPSAASNVSTDSRVALEVHSDQWDTSLLNQIALVQRGDACWPEAAASNIQSGIPRVQYNVPLDQSSLVPPRVSSIDDLSEVAGSGAGRQGDPIHAVVLGDAGMLPPTVRLASQKIPADPPPNPEMIPVPDPVPVNVEPSGLPPSGPVIIQPIGLFNSWWAGPKKVDAVQDRGIGYERVEMAPFIMDIAQPMTQWALRIDAANNWRFPDEAEYLLSQPTSLGGKGPTAQNTVNYQDVAFIGEMGNSSASVRLTVPVRIIEGDAVGDTAGPGDLQVTTKLVLLTGERLKIAQYLNISAPTGAADRGLGTGTVSIEPGLLASYRWSDETYIHAEVKYLIPIPTSPGEAGTVLTWGFAASHLLYDGDLFAVIPTAELMCYTIFNAGETIAGPVPILQPVEHEVIPTLHFGARFVSDRFRDIGTVEIGISAGANLGATGWYADLVRFEARVMY